MLLNFYNSLFLQRLNCVKHQREKKFVSWYPIAPYYATSLALTQVLAGDVTANQRAFRLPGILSLRITQRPWP